MTKKNTLDIKNEMIQCPVCRVALESEFALKGHLRLTMDPEHQAFRRQQQEIKNKIPAPIEHTPPNSPESRLIDIVEYYFVKKKQADEQETKDTAFLQKVKGVLQEEREVEQQYQDLIDSEEARFEQVRDEIEAELTQQFQQKVDATVAQEKEKWMQSHQQEVNNARMERNKEEQINGYNAAILKIPDPVTGNLIIVPPNSPLHHYLIKLIQGAWVSHQAEAREVFEQQHIMFRKQNFTQTST